MNTTIQLGPTTTPRSNFIADAALPEEGRTDAEWEMLDLDTNEAEAAQLDAVNGEPRVSWYVKELAPGEKRAYELRRCQSSTQRPGVDLFRHDDDGRLVIYYGGLLQTIYQYGAHNYRPYFYPNVAPSGRPGSNVASTDGSQPKSITDNAPPDHTWHRSLWYACGDVNGIDFYLEPAHMGIGGKPHVGEGYGRIVHRSFDWVVSGPVWGGFRERVQWVAPDRCILVDDVRDFRMYRLRGRMRLFDIEAEFAPHGEAVTFGQTNENALPLLRVADVIDEWDGGTVSLSTGAKRSPDCFGQRAEWADCSGQLTRAAGHDPEIFGVAMLDHPSNRNHPNAWFVRGYGPLGANLPFFDGALTIRPGDAWKLRHRIYIHSGYAGEANVAGRFDEYANAVPTSVTSGRARPAGGAEA